MNHPSVTEMAHLILEKYLTNDMVTLDATCGNGNDTLFLAKHSKRVYAVDIQPNAIQNTKFKLQDYHNVLYFLEDHSKIKEFIEEPLDAAIFNFGYLPNSNHEITTKAETSLKAVESAMELLYPGGLCLLCFYSHPEGKKEKETITNWLKSQSFLWSIYETKIDNAPTLYILSKPTSGQ